MGKKTQVCSFVAIQRPSLGIIFISYTVTLAQVLQEVRALQEGLARIEIRNLRKELDCWHSNARTVFESSSFKDALIAYYHCAVDIRVKCMTTGRDYPRNEVRASHIIKRSTHRDTLTLFGLPADIDRPRNGILLLEPIVQSFDRKDICILYNPVKRQLTMKVLNPQLMEAEMRSEEHGKTYGTYGSIDGAVLQLPEGKFPYRRVLSMHAKFAFSRALHMGWIEDTEVLECYFNVSDMGLQEPLGLGHLSWQQVHTDTYTCTPGV